MFVRGPTKSPLHSIVPTLNKQTALPNIECGDNIRVSPSPKSNGLQMSRPTLHLACAMLLVFALVGNSRQPVYSQANDDAKPATTKVPENPFPNRAVAPAGLLDGGAEWLNTSKPLSLKDLKGKIVVIDFWTYCCINCIHVLPDLKFLEKKYAKEIVVIGCHSAKFENEKVGANIRDAIMRYEIEHPVVNDNEMVIWRKFGTRSWPTIALIDPEG